ncbi:hypothetical protein KC19_2G227700 [Ceratodon purpureus]|uniref:Uncharacterized protein n=1 Tax=Ceratodon purpureus TaxID=3225 RepID=A0A8T0IYA0_CERPU|nr:hypothetical protein KC19_2G227700 [Ceratodon purpureus]
MAMASSRLRCLKQLWSQRTYSSRSSRSDGARSGNVELGGGRDRVSSSSGRRRVRSEDNLDERTKVASPGSGHESQQSSSLLREKTRILKPEPFETRILKLRSALDCLSSDSQRRVQNGDDSLESTKSLAPEVGDKSEKSSSASNEGETEQSDPIPYMSTDFCDHRGMQLVFLGTSSSMPTLSRNTSCIALRLDGTIYMFDCGEGVQRQLHRTQFRHRAIDNIFITHMHGDHIFGLPGLLCMIGMTAPASRRPIEIYGPPGLRDWIRTTLKLAHARVPNKYIVHELVLQEGKRKRGNSKKGERANDWNTSEGNHQDELPGRDILCSEDDGLWHVHEDRKYKVVAGLLKHTIPCWGYVVEEQPKIGRFNVDRAKEAGVLPGPMCAKLQQGVSVILQDGRTVNPSDVLGPPRKGRKAVILGDTSDSRSLLVAARGADVLVHEATVLEEEARLASRRGHSTASTAGKFARMIDAKSLVLTHFSGKLEGSLYGTSEKGTIADLVWAAKRTFGKQSVMAASDLAAVTVVANLDEPLPTQ